MIYTLHPELAPFVGKHYVKAPFESALSGGEPLSAGGL